MSWFKASYLAGVVLMAASAASAYAPNDQGRGTLPRANLQQRNPGDNCSEPVPTDFFGPGSDPFDGIISTCGHGDDYSDTCLGSYDGGEDIILSVVVVEPVCLTLTASGLTPSDNWIGMVLDDSCPPNPTDCLATATSSSSTVATIPGVNLPVGEYYVMVDTWPPPSCVNFELVIMPCATGACCLASGVCLPDMTQLECVAVGGGDWYVGVPCFPDNPCPQPWLNDICPDAIPVTEGTPAAIDDNCPASTTDWAEASCQSNSNKDLWYEYTPSCNGEIVMDTEGSGQSDTVLSVYATCEGPEIACDDDSGTGNWSRLSFFGIAGVPYYVRFASYSTGCGPFNLNIVCNAYGACCLDSACTPDLTAAQCAAQGGIWQGAGTDCFPNPCVPIDYYWDTTTGEMGGNGYDGAWLYYPYAPDGPWYNMWWPNEYAPDRQKEITISFTVEFPIGGYLDVAVVWSTPDWQEFSRPPFASEEQYIGRAFLETITAPGTYTYATLLPFCPAWVSIDVRGDGYAIEGIIRHICLPPTLGACCFGPVCAMRTAADCGTEGGVYQGDGTGCFPNPCVPRDYWLRVSDGVVGAQGGTGYAQTWFLYPNNWWNQWWPNEFALDREKDVTITFDVDFLPGLPPVVAFNYSEMGWPDPLNPPLPADDPFVIRVPVDPPITAPGTYTYTTRLPFCPLWVSMDVQGDTFAIEGTIEHICLPPPWCLGDLNCSGGSPTFDDIKYFSAAIGSESSWWSYFVANQGFDPPCPWLAGDYNYPHNGVEFSDIKPFAASIGQPCLPYVP